MFIPCDHVRNWPTLQGELSGGLTITVQRLEHQYKVVIQHVVSHWFPDISHIFILYIGIIRKRYKLRAKKKKKKKKIAVLGFIVVKKN